MFWCVDVVHFVSWVFPLSFVLGSAYVLDSALCTCSVAVVGLSGCFDVAVVGLSDCHRDVFCFDVAVVRLSD